VLTYNCGHYYASNSKRTSPNFELEVNCWHVDVVVLAVKEKHESLGIIGQEFGLSSGTLVLKHAVAWSVVEGPVEPEEDG